MTNWEKFKEVFGIPMDSKLEFKNNICEILFCEGIIKCSECPLCKINMDLLDFWDDEYEKSEV